MIPTLQLGQLGRGPLRQGRLDQHTTSLAMCCSKEFLMSGQLNIGYCYRADSGDTARQFVPNAFYASEQIDFFYDQSGVANHLLETTTAFMPSIESAAYVKFAGTDTSTWDKLYSSNNCSSSTGLLTIYMRCALRSSAATSILYELGINFNNADACGVYYDHTVPGYVLIVTTAPSGNNRGNVYNSTDIAAKVRAFRFDRSQATAADKCAYFVDGVKQTPSSNISNGTAPNGNFGASQKHSIGARGADSGAVNTGGQLNLYDILIYEGAAHGDSTVAEISALLALVP
jgi:hypothetical protein